MARFPSPVGDQRMYTSGERILVVQSERGQAARLQRELKSTGYILVPTKQVEEALDHLRREETDLMIVAGKRVSPPQEGSSEADAENPSGGSTTAGKGGADVYEWCRILKSDPKGSQVPLLLVVSLWDELALPRGLEAGADYFLFAPYQEQDVLHSVRNALLNRVAAEPSCVLPRVEVISRDRMHHLGAGRGRLARLLFSVFDELQQSRSALAWSQAEVREVRGQLRRERERAEGGITLQELAQGVAHDFSNLVETLRTATTVLEARPAEPAPYRAAMDAALAQTEVLVAALQNFALFEDEGLPMETVDLAALVRGVLETALLPLCAPNVEVQVRVENLPLIRSNSILLSRSLNNLVWNSVQAMPSGGTLRILGAVKGEKGVLEVSDTGMGIDEQDQKRIFRPGFTTKNGHSGLGLSLVRSLVRRAGGEIGVVSRIGQGTTFALSFPKAAPELSHPQPGGKPKRALAMR